MLFAILKFALWEAAVWAAALRMARRIGWREGAEMWLGTLAIQIAIESSAAALFSFAGWNSALAYWIAGAVCAAVAVGQGHALPRQGLALPHIGIAALTAPLIVLSFRPVEEIDSINYLHYLIDWMANRATPYTFATNYVAFWELSFLPVWTITGYDWFFPLLALKAVVLLALALWLAGRELNLNQTVLPWAIFGALTMRHYWFEYSGVPTLKNDVLHGAGFVLLALVLMRGAQRKLSSADIALLAFGASFASVKYTGIFMAAIAFAFLLLRRRSALLPVSALFLITSGHYYVRSLILYGSPFYPFQINFGPIHLPGTADLSYSSILYNLHDPRLWRALFLPAGGVSPAGLLFPAILAATLLVGVWRCVRGDWLAGALLAGWLLYFRSVYSACAGPGDLAFILNKLNSIRYVDGVLALSELFLAVFLGRWALPLIAVNAVSRIVMLYTNLDPKIIVLAIVIGVAVCLCPRPLACLMVATVVSAPFLGEHNRAAWTTGWNDLKPHLEEFRNLGLAELALEDGGYFAGHVVAAGNPVQSSVRSLLPDEMDQLPTSERPAYLAVLVTRGSEAGRNWGEKYRDKISSWGYRSLAESPLGAVFQRDIR